MSEETESLNLELCEGDYKDSEQNLRISTVKDTNNSILNDFKLEKNYIFFKWLDLFSLIYKYNRLQLNFNFNAHLI